jgi:2-polyprenyl-3-methyl-5-hydroxy-6-metoxy-1,4-benzoquinol methylase
MGLQKEKNIQNLEDDIFCLSYETNAMADLLIRKETERWVAGFANLDVEVEHVSRYKWALDFVNNKRVLDIACGSGFGSFLFCDKGKAKEVIGCDLDLSAIKYASIKYSRPNLKFVCEDAIKFEDDNKFDVIVSFETIEHIPNADEFLSKINSLLKDNGEFYVSTPISSNGHDKRPNNPYHIQEWGIKEFNQLVAKYFVVKETFLQMREENYTIKFYWVIIKQKIQYLLNFRKINIFKNKFLGDNKMNPTIYNKDIPYKNYYGIVGLQILKLTKIKPK